MAWTSTAWVASRRGSSVGSAVQATWLRRSERPIQSERHGASTGVAHRAGAEWRCSPKSMRRLVRGLTPFVGAGRREHQHSCQHAPPESSDISHLSLSVSSPRGERRDRVWVSTVVCGRVLVSLPSACRTYFGHRLLRTSTCVRTRRCLSTDLTMRPGAGCARGGPAPAGARGDH